MSKQSFENIIADFGRLLGISDMIPDQGLCQLEFNKGQTLQIAYVGARNMLLLSCPLDFHHPDQTQLEVMAQSNFLQAAAGAVACTAPDGQVHLQLGVRVEDSSARSLFAASEALLAEATRWQDLLAGRADKQKPHGPAFLIGQSV